MAFALVAVATGAFFSLVEAASPAAIKPGSADDLRAAYATPADIAEGKKVTYDLKPTRDDPTAVGTKEMADEIIKKIKK